MPATQITGSQVLDGTIRNADIASDAAISGSKIANLATDLASKQATLVSGTNIKTVNSNSLLGSGNVNIGGETCNVEALTADKTLTASDAPIQMYTCTANSIVNLPTTGLTVGQKFEIWNRNAYDSIFYISVNQSSTMIDILYSQKVSLFKWSGTNWIYEFGEYNVAVGYNADAYGYGVAVGRSADGSSYGAAVGVNANGSNYGVAVGNTANGTSYGVAVGASASGLGYGVAVGYKATCNIKGAGTTSLGTYSAAERKNEFVSTATNGTTNKAQLTIQKYCEKNLATASAAWQELFTDGTSARLTIHASSVYHFRAQINAIDITTFDVKTWDISGAIKRNATTVSIVGTPTKTVTSADTATTNWDAQITADDTNKSLKVEVKHDSANNVRFSLNIFATETRI